MRPSTSKAGSVGVRPMPRVKPTWPVSKRFEDAWNLPSRLTYQVRPVASGRMMLSTTRPFCGPVLTGEMPGPISGKVAETRVLSFTE